jgi:hypothetical protein
MAKRKSAPKGKKQTYTDPLPVLVSDCVPEEDPIVISTSGENGPQSIYFKTSDSSRVYEVVIKKGVFGNKPIKAPFWCCHDTPVFTVEPNAKKETFAYKIKVLVGPSCDAKLVDPPTIMVEE